MPIYTLLTTIHTAQGWLCFALRAEKKCRHLPFDEGRLVQFSFWLLVGKVEVWLLLSPMRASLCELAQPGIWRLALPESLAPGQHEQLRGSRGRWVGVGRCCASDKDIAGT